MKKLFFVIIPVFLASVIFFVAVVWATSVGGKGALQVTSVPKSHVYVDGKLVGDSPMCLCALGQYLPVGMHTLRLVPVDGGGEDIFEDNVYIESNVLTVVDRESDGISAEADIITLRSLPEKGSVEVFVSSFPVGADVFVDGKHVGQTPITLKNLEEGDRSVVIRKSGYKSKELRIRASSGFQLQLTAILGVDLSEKFDPSVLGASTVATATVASPSATPTPTATTSAKIVILNTPTGFLRVRADHSLNASESARVTPGQVFDLMSEIVGWFEIKLNDGRVGWVSSDYAKKQ